MCGRATARRANDARPTSPGASTGGHGASGSDFEWYVFRGSVYRTSVLGALMIVRSDPHSLDRHPRQKSVDGDAIRHLLRPWEGLAMSTRVIGVAVLLVVFLTS